jgi:ADP-ribose pyrophosphatase YjhB (NUDIX family)
VLTAAAIREAREECGLEVRLDGLVNIYSYPRRAPVIVVYAATAIGGTLSCDEECLESAEFDAESIPWDRLAFRSTEEGLRDYLAGLLHPVRL